MWMLDPNVVLYLLSGDVAKATSGDAVGRCGIVSVQILNAVANVTRRSSARLGMKIGEILSQVRAVRRVEPLANKTRARPTLSDSAVSLAYDAMIIASALEVGRQRLYTEDLQDGQRIDGFVLTIRNPFDS